MNKKLQTARCSVGVLLQKYPFLPTLLIAVCILFHLFLSSYYVRHGDITFTSDIARDFHLFREIDQKKLILIGPRSSVSGLFHGPLWLYINYPAYLLGKGNPIAVGYNWIILIGIFSFLYYGIVKHIIGNASAFLFSIIFSLYSFFHAHSMFNPHGVYFLLPLFFLMHVLYLKQHKRHHLLLHILIGGLMVQFQLAIGIPYLILSFLLTAYVVYKRKSYKDLLLYFLVLIPLINYIVFEIRHNFPLYQNILRFLSSHKTVTDVSYSSMIIDRLRMMFIGMEFVRTNQMIRNVYTLIFIIYLYTQIKQNKFKLIYLLFVYYYAGYFLLSFINRGYILYFYLFPQFSLVFLIFSTFIYSKYKKLFFLLFSFMYIFNLNLATQDLKNAHTIIGNDKESWKFLFNMSQEVFTKADDTFGYFVYSPDSFGYQPKYALLYISDLHAKNAKYFTKMPDTFIISAPRPPDNPYMQDTWWKQHQVHITTEPIFSKTYPNGYTIEKHILSSEDIAVPFDTSIDPGIHFR